jgi:UDP-N-acetylmuramate dehydrogenase
LDELVILSAQFQLEEEEPDALTRRMQQQWIVKKAALPLAHQHCGNVFRNPRGMSAGMLIDQAGLMGTRVGGAEVSDRHANFIVADDRCSSGDVLRLIDLVRGRVAQRVGVELEMELEVW